MTHRRLLRLAVLVLVLAVPARALGDDVSYLPDSATLVYTMDFDQMAALAEAGDCTRAAFENSLLHSVVRNLFLFLPLEASYHPDAVTLAVEVIGTDAEGRRGPLLRVEGDLERLRATNGRFRTFVNGFASIRSGYCFTVADETLDLWLGVLTARGATVAVAADVLETELPQATALDTPTDPSPEVPDVSVSERYLPEGFQATPYLSELRVRTFSAPAAVLEPDTDYAAVVLTSKGRLVVDLLEDEAPQTVNSFVFLARHRFYDGIVFHRVIEDFMAQTGDPTGTGLGGPGYGFADEISPALRHRGPGVVSMANAGPDSNGSQFFITLTATPWLDGDHTIFGAVSEGLEVLAELQRIDPAQPLAVVRPDDSLDALAAQGVDLAEPDDGTVADLLERRLGRLPAPGERVRLDEGDSGGFDVVIGTSGQGDEPWIGFWPAADRIEALYIVERPKR